MTALQSPDQATRASSETTLNDGSLPGQMIKTGIPGLDDILGGGLTANRLYLIEGIPGSGKTTIAMQILLEGVRSGEHVLYVTLSESADELHEVARSHGWTLDGVTIRELTPSQENLLPDDQYTMFHPSEIELGETTRVVLEDVERIRPSRVVFDSLSELRLLAGNPLRYRRQILALKQFFTGKQCTVVLLDNVTSSDHDLQVQSVAHGVLMLEQANPEYGADRRRMRVIKYRGVRFRSGFHDYIIKRGGVEVYPRLVAAEYRSDRPLERISGGIAELDKLLGGGIERGTSTLIVGAAGTGKSTLASRFVWSAAEAGESAAMFLFDESRRILLSRCENVGMDLRPHVESGRISIQQIDPAELSPGELVDSVRRAVTHKGASIVVIDSLNGYLNAMPGERHLIIQLHELLSFLGDSGVATLLISAQHGFLGTQMHSPIDASYLADAVVLMRYYETMGEVRQAISVLKKRGGAHERAIREFCVSNGCIEVGKPLRSFRGVLTGVPEIVGSKEVLRS